MKIKLIVAISENGVIGKNSYLPWGRDYPEDLLYFKEQTLNKTIIMGRNTFDSIGRPLPKRRNIVLSKRLVPKFNAQGVEHFLSLEDAVKTCTNDAFLIGGSSVYEEGLKIAEELHITTIPRVITGDNLVYFPKRGLENFKSISRTWLNEEKNLFCNVYVRK